MKFWACFSLLYWPLLFYLGRVGCNQGCTPRLSLVLSQLLLTTVYMTRVNIYTCALPYAIYSLFWGGGGGGRVKLSKNMMWENGVTERETPGREWTWWRFKQSIKMWGSPRNNTCTSVYLHPLKISEVKFTYPGQHPHIPSVPLLFLGGTENGNGKIRLDKTRAVRLRKRTKYTFRGTTTGLSALSEIAQILVERFTPTGLHRTFS